MESPLSQGECNTFNIWLKFMPGNSTCVVHGMGYQVFGYSSSSSCVVLLRTVEEILIEIKK